MHLILKFLFIIFLSFQRKTQGQFVSEWRHRNPEKSKQQGIKSSAAYRERLKYTQSDEDKIYQRKNDAERKRKSRLKLTKQKADDSKVFPTPQVKGKLLKRTRKTLKGTQNQNFSVLKDLLNEIEEQGASKEPVVTGHHLPNETVKKVQEFYQNDEISRASPNVKDSVSVFKNNQKQKLSVKHLLYSVKEIYGMFREEFPSVKISLSKFFGLKPINVLSFAKIPHNICVCQLHENIRCCLKSLIKIDAVFADLFTDSSMHKNFVCEISSEQCFTNNCNVCCNAKKLKQKAEALTNPSKQISWNKWIKSDKNKDVGEDGKAQYCNVEKVKKSASIISFLDEMYDTIPDFLDHQFIKMNQAKTSAEQILNASSSDSIHAVICCDFAENFKCIQQNATQTANYGQTPITLFTVAVYHQKVMPIVIASDFEKHGKECVLVYIEYILSKLPSTAKIVDIWSDNATSQFKNQFVMQGIKTFEEQRQLKIRWNFYAPMHGKSVVDGIGGNVKRFVRNRIIAQDLLVQTAAEFAAIAATMETEVVAMNKADVDRRNISIGLKDIVKNAKKIEDIKKNHFFECREVKSGKKLVKKVVGQKITPH